MTDTPANERGWGQGWPSCSQSKWQTFTILGEHITLRPEVHIPVDYLCRRFNAEVEPFVGKQLDDWGAACRPIRGSNPPVASNHSWAIAIDVNATQHPLGVSGTFTSSQVLAIHLMIGEMQFFRWGGDYHDRVDSQHFEFMGTPTDATVLTKRIQRLLPWEKFPGAFGQGHGGHEGNLVRSRLGQSQSATGVLDAKSISLLRGFQSQRHLPVTGIVDARTWARLEWRLP